MIAKRAFCRYIIEYMEFACPSNARKFRKARAVAEIERQPRLRWVGGRGLAKVPA